MQANVRGQLGPEVQVIGCPRKRYAAAGCERVHVWPIADEEGPARASGRRGAAKITAPRPPHAKAGPEPGLRAN
jgi:hypothetical protein